MRLDFVYSNICIPVLKDNNEETFMQHLPRGKRKHFAASSNNNTKNVGSFDIFLGKKYIFCFETGFYVLFPVFIYYLALLASQSRKW